MIQILYVDEMLYVSGLGFVKIGLLLTYLRFFSSKRFRHAVLVMCSVCLVYILAFDIASVFQCTPISFTWSVNRAATTRVRGDSDHSFQEPVGWRARRKLPELQRSRLDIVSDTLLQSIDPVHDR